MHDEVKCNIDAKYIQSSLVRSQCAPQFYSANKIRLLARVFTIGNTQSE